MSTRNTPKAKPLFQNPNWVAGLAEGPVFIDGMSHHLFYLICACKNASDQYSAVVIGKFNSDYFKVKFYGSFEEWGFNKASLADKFRATSFLSRANSEGYERYMTDRQGVRMIVEALAKTRGVATAPVDLIWDAYDIPMTTREKTLKMLNHTRGARRPAIPFTPPMLLTQAAPV